MTARHWTALAALAALALAAGLAWCIAASPLTLYDGLGPILDSSRVDDAVAIFRRAMDTPGYLRPLRLAQIKAAYDLAPANPIGTFKAIHVALTLAAFLAFVAWLRPSSAAEAAAALVALVVVAGHHSMFMLLAEAYPINHFLEMVVLALLLALLARGAPRWWKAVLAPIILIVALATLESGLLLAVVAVTCWLVGWRGITGRGVIACLVVVAGYFWIRFGVLQIVSPGLDERAAGWGMSRLEPEELIARFQANRLPFYAYNVVSSLLDVLFSQPRNGTWIMARRWIDGDFTPWMAIHLGSSLIISLMLLAAAVRALPRWWSSTLDDRDRFVLLAVAMVGANAVISFGYVKDDVLSLGATFYAAGAFAVLARAAERASAGGRGRQVAAAVLIAASLLWTVRATGTFFSLRAFAYRTGADWARYSLERELPADAATDHTRRLFERMRDESVRRGGPHVRFTNEPAVQPYVEIQ